MIREIELSSLDLRYEGYRMKNPALEARLLSAIAERGIEEPLEGVDTKSGSILLNGFKRLRCARKLRIGIAPYKRLGEDEAVGIVCLLRVSNARGLSILEQAAFVDELKRVHGKSVAEIADDLSRSKGWVSMRQGLIGAMSERVREKLFSGQFPAYSYMHLRQFMRMNGGDNKGIEDFVVALSGQKLSTRDIEQLAHGFFRGSESFRQQILSGHVKPALQAMKAIPDNPEGCTEFERIFVGELERLHKYMGRTIAKSEDPRLKSPAAYAEVHLLSGGILSRVQAFEQAMEKLHDRCANT